MSDATLLSPPSILAAVGAYLVVPEQIRDLMGAGHEARIRPESVPMRERFAKGSPHLVYTRISTEHLRVLHGETRSLHRSVVQIDVYAKDAQERESLAHAVRMAMRPNRFRGVWADVEIRDVSLDLDVDSSSDPADGTEEMDWRTMLRFTIRHRNLTEV